VYGVPWTVVFPLLDTSGELVTGATCDSEISKNGDTGVDCTNEGVEITFTTATNKGFYGLVLTAAEMTADIVSVTVHSATSAATSFVLYPRKLVTLATGTSAGGAVGYITLAASTVAYDGEYNGCLCVATIDTNVEARVLQACTTADQQCTVTPSWNVAPDADDTYIIYLPEGRQIPQADVTAVSRDTTAANNLELMYDGTGYVGGAIALQADLTKIHGTAITETATQLAGAFTKFFDVATPTGTINSIPDAVAGAAGGLFIAGTNAATAVTTAFTSNIIGDITGALSGAVGSVTGAVGSIGAGGIVEATFGADAITNAKIADDAIAAENLKTGAISADAFAADAIVAGTLATGALSADAFAVDALVAATFATDSIAADALKADAATQIATAVLAALADGVAVSDILTRLNALAKGKIARTTDTSVYKKEDGTTTAFTNIIATGGRNL